MLQWLNQFLLSGNWHYSILLSLQPTYAVNAESKLCAKVRKSHLWSMNLTTGRDSSHDPALTHICTNTNTPSIYTHTTYNAYTHTRFTLPSAVADVPTWHRVPGHRFRLDRIHVALLWSSIQVRHISSAESRFSVCELIFPLACPKWWQHIEYNQP